VTSGDNQLACSRNKRAGLRKQFKWIREKKLRVWLQYRMSITEGKQTIVHVLTLTDIADKRRKGKRKYKGRPGLRYKARWHIIQLDYEV
jgi:hypothetical protein